MLDAASTTTILAATSVAVLHTAIGPDHYVPFVALAKARGWSRARTLNATVACGVAHVASSLALGAAAILVGTSLGVLEVIERSRGTFAAWALVAFGIVYALWGATRAPHRHRDGDDHDETTVWTLFLVFVLGPCEPLVPLVFFPAAAGHWELAASTAAAFGVATVVTMVLLVDAVRAGVGRMRLTVPDGRTHAAAGVVLVLSGVAMLLGA